MKAILVIDEMPSKCEECPLCVDYGLYRLCVFGKFDIEVCPLKPMPTKITTATLSEREQERTELLTSMALLKTYADGWNDCLKGIEQEPYGGYKTTGVESLEAIK